MKTNDRQSEGFDRFCVYRSSEYFTGCRDNIRQRNDHPVSHDQSLLRNRNVPHPTGHGYIRAARLPFIWNEVFDGHFRMLRQMDDVRDKATVQFDRVLLVNLKSLRRPARCNQFQHSRTRGVHVLSQTPDAKTITTQAAGLVKSCRSTI